MAIALVANTAKSLYYTGVDTTSAIDTTGANLLVVCFSYYTAGADPSVTDSKGNTYTKLTPREGGVAGALIYYCQGGTVGAGHTFSCDASSANRMISVMAFSGVAASPLGLQSGATSGGATSIAPGSVTPAQDGELIVAMAALRDGGTVSVNDGFTIANQVPYDANIGIAAAYKVQTTAAAANPSFSWASSVYCSAALATFKAETGGAGIASGSAASVSLTAPNGSATGTSPNGSATGSFGAVTLTAPNGTATGSTLNGSASGAVSAVSLTAATGSASGTTSGAGTITLGPLKNNTGTVLASLTGITVHVYQTSGALVVTKTGQTTNGSGTLVVSDAAIAAATQYRCVIVLGTGAEGMDKATAA